MAYGNWSSNQSLTLKESNYYKVSLIWRYRQDAYNHKTQVQTLSLQVQSKNSNYSFTASNTVYGLTHSGQTRSTKSGSLSVGGGKTVTLDTEDVAVEYAHSTSDGKMNATNVFNWILNPSFIATGFPSWTYTAWQSTAQIRNLIPAIDVTAATTTLTKKSVSYSKATFNLSTNSSGDLYIRLGNSGPWTFVADRRVNGGGNADYTLTGLTPATTYTVQMYAWRSWNNINSTPKSLTFTTNAVPAPSVPQIVISDITHDGFNLTLPSGGVLYDTTTKLDGEAGSMNVPVWKRVNGVDETEKVIYDWDITAEQARAGKRYSGLEPETSYHIALWTNAPLSNAQAHSDVIITTPPAPSNTKLQIKTANGWVSGEAYIKTANGWKKGIPYVKTSSGWKKGV